MDPCVELPFHAVGHLGIGHLDGVELGLMEEELLYGELLWHSEIGVTVDFLSFHLHLHPCHFDVGFQNGFVAHYPNYFVDDA